MLSLSSSSSRLITVLLCISACLSSLSLARKDRLDDLNVTVSNVPSVKPDTFADIIDRALEKEFTETEQAQATDVGSFNNSVTEQEAVLETVARVKPKQNDTKEEMSFKLHDVFNLDNDNRAEDTLVEIQELQSSVSGVVQHQKK